METLRSSSSVSPQPAKVAIGSTSAGCMTAGDQLYTREFFQMCLAVALFMTGVALQFHFGQYMGFLGHGVDTIGMVLSLSVVGTLLIRLQIGDWIDRFGCRPVWLIGTAIVAVTVGSIQFVSQLWLIVLLRMTSTMATALAMTTVAVFAANVAPPRRRAESIGTMGLAGFVGMLIGPTLGDLIFAGASDTITPYRVFFTTSALLSLLGGAVLLVVHVPSGSVPRASQETISENRPASGAAQRAIIYENWPGWILLISVVFSMVFCVQSLFLEGLAEARGFMNIKLFFLVYAPTAMTLRLVFRRLPERIGRSRTLLTGMMLFAMGLACLTEVSQSWHLAIPGLLMGAGHCFIFPSMVDLAADRLPPERRGTGTALVLGAGDVGMLIGYWSLGELIETYDFGVALWTLAGVVMFAAFIFAVSRWRQITGRRGQRRTSDYIY